MIRWQELLRLRPDLTDAGRELLYEYGVGLAFLSTVRRDGGPRTHSICPILVEDRLFGLIIPSPKLDDLRRDSRYALHSHPCADNEDAFYLTGKVEFPDDVDLRLGVDRAFLAERGLAEDPFSLETQTLVEFLTDTCLLTRTTGHGDTKPVHVIWKAETPPAQSSDRLSQ